MAEKYLHIWRTDQKAPQTRIQKDFMPQKTFTYEPFLLLCLCTYGDDETRLIQTKKLKIVHTVTELFLESNISNVSVKVQNKIFDPKTYPTDGKI